MASSSRRQLEEWLKTIKLPALSKVLDIGGAQNPINSRVAHIGEGTEFKILDLETPHETKQKPDLIFDLNDAFPSDHNHDLWVNDQFDIAFCLEVSEYWYNPFYALQNINYLLKKDGILYISFHFLYPVHNPVEQDYLRYTPNGARKLLKEAGFEILEEQPRLFDETIHMGLYATEGMRPAKGYQEHGYQGLLIKAKKI